MRLRDRVLAAAIALAVCLPAAADTIYLLNGRTIHTDSVKIHDGRAVFRQYGGTVSIPLSEILRIEKDSTRERPSASNAPARPAASVASSNAATGAAAAPAPSSVTPTPPPFVFGTVVAPYNAADFWLERLTKVDSQIARVQTELDRLPEYSEAEKRQFRFSGQIMYFVNERDKWEGFMRRLQTQRSQIERGARKAGITPGALRDGLSRQSN